MGKFSPEAAGKCGLLDALTNDLLIFILCKLSATAGCPSDFVNVLSTCKRLNRLALSSDVLSRASQNVFAVKAEKWSDSAHRFFGLCVDAGNPEAWYTLGMDQVTGFRLMIKAAVHLHAPALYSLAVIYFNGSANIDKSLRDGVNYCTLAAMLGNIHALRELGHCIQAGYGVRLNATEGDQIRVEVDPRELLAYLGLFHESRVNPFGRGPINYENLPVYFRCDVPTSEVHPADRFVADWFADPGRSPGRHLTLCSRVGCWRPETRMLEFRSCLCGDAHYCSRACQGLDWKPRHEAECSEKEEMVVDGEDEGELVALRWREWIEYDAGAVCQIIFSV